MRILRKAIHSGGWMRLRFRGVSHTLVLLLTLSLNTPAQKSQSQSLEFQLRAVFLFNFTQFIVWPSSSFTDEQAPLVIGVLGNNPYGNQLQEIILGEKVGGRSLTVKYYNQIEEVKSCQLLYINIPEADKLKEAIRAVKGKGIVTVSDASNFIKWGGMIKFITVNHKIHFQVNPDLMKAEGLEVSSKLLRLAEIVIPKTQ